MIPEEKWFTNLYTRGNTGCASIYLMLEELFHSSKLQPGEKIFCFVPESGRFTTAYMMLSVVQTSGAECIAPVSTRSQQQEHTISASFPISNINSENSDSVAADLLRQLALVWLEFERQLRSVSWL